MRGCSFPPTDETEDHDDIMPPKGDPLTKTQTDLIAQWIKEGAKMPEKIVTQETLWSYKAVNKPKAPSYSKSKSPIDSFLYRKLSPQT